MDQREHPDTVTGQTNPEPHNPLAQALAYAHLELRNPAKDGQNPHFNSRYATLDALQDASRAILARYGLSVTQVCAPAPGQSLKMTDGRMEPFLWHLRTILTHTSGQTIESVMPLVMVTRGAQQFGSEITYMRRYSYAAILNMTADEDDDGNAAQGNQTKKKTASTDILDSPLPEAWKKHEYKGPVDTDTGPDDIPGLPSQKDTPPAPEVDQLSPSPPEEQTLLEQVRDHLHTDNLSEEQLMTLLRQFKLTRSVMLKDVDSKTLSTVIGKWETVSKRIKDDLARKEEPKV